MTLKELLKKNHFVEETSAEKLINVVRKQLGDDVEFVKVAFNESNGILTYSTEKFIYKKAPSTRLKCCSNIKNMII